MAINLEAYRQKKKEEEGRRYADPWEVMELIAHLEDGSVLIVVSSNGDLIVSELKAE